VNKRAKKQQAAIAALRSLEPHQGQISSAPNDPVRVIRVDLRTFAALFRQFKGREPTPADMKRNLHM
jgi:hypothetical protein